MDELVERVVAEIEGTGLLEGDEAKSLARAIIPIVADWQRERDAGIADSYATGDRSEYGAGADTAAENIATAIRGAE